VAGQSLNATPSVRLGRMKHIFVFEANNNTFVYTGLFTIRARFTSVERSNTVRTEQSSLKESLDNMLLYIYNYILYVLKYIVCYDTFQGHTSTSKPEGKVIVNAYVFIYILIDILVIIIHKGIRRVVCIIFMMCCELQQGITLILFVLCASDIEMVRSYKYIYIYIYLYL